MATGAAFYFNMIGFNKQAITPDFAAKHMSYILNRNKVRAVGSQHAPAHFWHAQDWLEAHYTLGRKNARVWTRFILNLPHDLTHVQRVQLVKHFLAEMSQGRAQFVWAIHKDTQAPHAHVVFVDKDVATGRRVAQLTEAGSAHRWRKVWEDCCNRALEWAGSLSRVSRMGKESAHYRQLNERAREHARSASSTALSPIPRTFDVAGNAPLCHQLPPDTKPMQGVNQESDERASSSTEVSAMDAVIKQEAHIPSISGVVAFVSSQMLELERLRAAKQTIVDYRATYAEVTTHLIRTQGRLEGVDPELQRAAARVVKAEQEEARHQGVAQRIWQMVSPSARARAKAAKTASDMAVYSLSTLRIKANTLLREAQALQIEQKSLHEKAAALKSSLAIYGTDADIDEAEKSLMRTISVNAAELTAVELSQAFLAGHITPDEHRQLLRAIDRNGIEV